MTLPSVPADGGVSTGNVADLHISWKDQVLKSVNNAAFAGLFAAVTNTASLDVELSGTADVVAKTTVGNIPISGIPFDVTSSLAGR